MRGASLSWSSPDDWPPLARGGLLLLIAVLAAWAFGRLSLQSELRMLHQLRAQAQQGREDYRSRLAQSQAMAALRERREALRDALWPDGPVERLSAPTQAWTEALLRDLHRVGQGRLRFELFRPGTSVTRPHHEELPFTLRVVGTYQDIAVFVADLATRAQVITLDRLMLLPRASGGEAGDTTGPEPGLLVLDLVARACRPLAAHGRPAAGALFTTSPGSR